MRFRADVGFQFDDLPQNRPEPLRREAATLHNCVDSPRDLFALVGVENTNAPPLGDMGVNSSHRALISSLVRTNVSAMSLMASLVSCLPS